uniref:Secreted phosphoprotein 1 n=1 Tax=Panagrellus redivivus TaxID=6233 RepID=A0A7E4WD44_PANRE
MTTISAFVAFCVIAVVIEGRYIDKDIAGSRYASKVFDYYDVAKGNVPSYLLGGDKQFEDYEEDREPIKIGQLSDNLRDMIKQDSLSERPLAPADSEIQPETLDVYEDYAEQAVNKPLEIPVSDVETETETESGESKPAEADSTKTKPLIDGESATPSSIIPKKQPIETEKLTLTDTEDDSDLISDSDRATEGVPDTFNTTEEPINDAVEEVMVLETVKPLCDDDKTEAPKTE